MEKLYLRFNPRQYFWDELSETVLYWSLADSVYQNEDNGKIRLENVKELAQDREVIVFLPVADVLLREVQLKARKHSQALKAIPYLLEEDLAEDTERLQFALSERNANDEYAVAVISKDKLNRLLEALTTVGVRPSVITVDSFGLPLPESSGWTACLQDNHVLVRTGQWSGFSCDSGEFATFCKLHSQSTGSRPENIRLYAHPDADILPLRESDFSIERADEWSVSVYYRGFDPEHSINLLQGAYATQTRRSADLRPWKTAAVLSGICLVAWLGLMSFDIWRLQQQQTEVDNALLTALANYFPDITDVHQARATIKEKLKSIGGQGTGKNENAFIRTLATTATALQQHPDITVQQIQYRSDRLELALQVADIQSLERLKGSLGKNALQVDVKSATSEGSATSAQLSVWE